MATTPTAGHPVTLRIEICWYMANRGLTSRDLEGYTGRTHRDKWLWGQVVGEGESRWTTSLEGWMNTITNIVSVIGKARSETIFP
jgi:hypothetical protein